MNKPLVSVCMITYNHEAFIEEAMQGVMMQETDFPIEFVIANDASTDKTDQVIAPLVLDNERITFKYFNHKSNQGMMPNFIFALGQCTGKYISLCEGDDYWTDPLKLQKQVDFLEENSKFSLGFHNVNVINNRKGREEVWQMHENLRQTEFTTKDIIGQWFIPTASIIFRNKNLILPEWFVHCGSGDIPLILILSLQGDIKYLHEIMGVYRLHNTGISIEHTGYSKVFSMIFIYQNFNIYTDFKFQKEITDAMIYEVRKHLPEVKELKNIKNRGNKRILKRIFRKLKNWFY